MIHESCVEGGSTVKQSGAASVSKTVKFTQHFSKTTAFQIAFLSFSS